VRPAVTKPDIIILIGRHAYRWQEICELRRQQLEAWKAAQPKQPSLFELKDDRRPLAERTAAGVIMSRPFSHSSPMRNCCP